MTCRDAENDAEHHMLRVWFVRFVAMATNHGEDHLALMLNREARLNATWREMQAAGSWGEWIRAAKP